MAMTEALHLALALAAGLLLGAVFFGGLWWTVRRALTGNRPALWLVGSLLLRSGVTLAGFYLVGNGHWQRLVMCLCGFIAARLVMQRLVRPPEATHAP
jgi:F1F0 ATPase subunit 2